MCMCNLKFISRWGILFMATMSITACGSSGSGVAVPPATNNVTREATLTTAQEVPTPSLPDPAAPASLGNAVSNTSAGRAVFTLYSTNKLRGSMTITGFVSPATAPNDVTAAHIHEGVVGSNVPGTIVKGLVSDAAHVVWSLPANTTLTDAEIVKFKAGGYYVNAHTDANKPGLIRGQLISFAGNVQAIFTANCLGC